MQCAVITVSDKGARGQREDTAGPLTVQLLKDAGYETAYTAIVPDEQAEIEQVLRHCADTLQIPLIVTTGGTGLAPRDVTPEATLAVCEKLVPGIPEAMRAYCLPITNRAMLSRAVCGVRGQSLILNLPGSPKAVLENLAPVLPAIEHGLCMLLGTKNECAINAK